MIKRIYCDNYRCLNNFDLKLGKINILLGRNGSGKSTVFEVLKKIQDLLTGTRVTELFSADELTLWDKRDKQKFELEMELSSGVYLYRLEIEYDRERLRCRIGKEELYLDNKLLFEFKSGEAQLYHDDHQKGPAYPFDWSLSGIATINERADNKKLCAFKKAFASDLVAKINPFSMRDHVITEDNRLQANMENFAPWYKWLIQEHLGNVVEITNKLRSTIEGFDSINLKGDPQKELIVTFRQDGKNINVAFSKISEGQRVLISLYILLELARRLNYSLWLDEPDNFISLREIQPWMNELYDVISDSQFGQVVLISHHPVLINQLALSNGIWFERDPLGPTRVRYFIDEKIDESSIPISDLVERGWLYE